MGKKQESIQKNQIRAIEDKFLKLLENIFAETDSRSNVESYISFKDKGSIRIDWDKQVATELVNAINNIIPNISYSEIWDTIQRYIFELVEDVVDNTASTSTIDYRGIQRHVNPENVVKQIIDDLVTKITNCTIIIPVGGIDLKVPSLRIGEYVLYPPDGELIAEIINAEKEYLVNVEKELAKAKCYAVLQNIMAEEGFARTKAITNFQDIIHILNLYTVDWQINSSGLNKISILGQAVNMSRRLTFVVNEAGRINFNLEALSYKNIPIDHEAIQLWKQHGFDRMITCFTTLNPSDIQNRIKRAITWFSKGVSSDANEESFVAYAIALESLLIGNEGKGLTANWGSINQRLADRVAFLLG